MPQNPNEETPPKEGYDKPVEKERQTQERPIKDPTMRRRKPNGGFIEAYKWYIATGIIVLIIAYVMIGSVAVSKEDFTTNLQGVATSIEAIKRDMGVSKNAVDTAVATIPNTITELVTKQVGDATKVFTDWQSKMDGTVAGINGVISKLQSDVITLGESLKGESEAILANSGRIDESVELEGRLESALGVALTRIATLEVKVVALEENLARTSSGDGDADEYVDIDVRVLDEGFPTSVVGNIATASLKVIVTNDSIQDLEDLIVSIVMYVEDVDGTPIFTLTESGDESWYIRTTQTRAVEIRNTRANIKAGEEWRTYLDVKMVFAQAEHDGAIDIEARVLDYD